MPCNSSGATFPPSLPGDVAAATAPVSFGLLSAPTESEVTVNFAPFGESRIDFPLDEFPLEGSLLSLGNYT